MAIQKKTSSKKSEPRANPKMLHALAVAAANCFVLAAKTQHYHWNIVGEDFHTHHEFLEVQYNELREGGDELAEQIRLIGAHVTGSMKMFLENTTLREANIGKGEKAPQIFRTLRDDHAAVIKQLQEAIDLADDIDDDATEDLLIGRLRKHQKLHWMLAASCK